MAKHDPLTEEEFSRYKPPARALDQLNRYMKSRGVTPGQIKVLDWGCGRGRFVLWLREQGFDAHGVDIDPEPIQNGLVLFTRKGYPDSSLTLFSPDGKTEYKDGSFDFIMTDNVLEHVRELDKVMAEISRLTAEEGAGYHIFPAQRQFIEGHLFMPFVHWLPQGDLRKAVIRFYVQHGKEPKWSEVERCSLEEKVDVYYKYSTDHLFYRPYKKIKRMFEERGFKVNLLSISNPAIARHKILGTLSRNPVTKPIINWLILTFKQVELTIQKSIYKV